MSIRHSLSESRCTVDGEVVTIDPCQGRASVNFELGSVLQVLAYKLDLFSFDQVRVCFYCTDSRAFDISEDDSGFDVVMSAAEAVLIGFPALTEWKPSVTAEPFARSETCLWQRHV